MCLRASCEVYIYDGAAKMKLLHEIYTTFYFATMGNTYSGDGEGGKGGTNGGAGGGGGSGAGSQAPGGAGGREDHPLEAQQQQI